MDDASHGSPGTDLVPLAGGRALPHELTTAVDVVLGAGSRAVGVGRTLVRAAERVAGAVPGGRLAGALASAAARPLVEEGERTRQRATAEAQRVLEVVVPAIVELVDVDAIVRRIDADAVVRRVDVEALLARVDLDALIARVDVDAIAARVDVNAIVQRVDVDAVVEETELGTIVARSTSGFAAEALDAARTQTVSADTLVTRLVDRVLRRRGEAPLGPSLLVPDEAPPAEPAPPDEPPPGAVP